MFKKKRNMVFLIIALAITFFILLGVLISIGKEYDKAEPFSDGKVNIDLCDYKNIKIHLKDDIPIEEKKDQLWEYVVSNTDVKKIPKIQLEKRKKEEYDNYKQDAKDAKYKDFDDYITNGLKIEKEVLEKFIEETAKTEVTEEMIAYAIADREGISVSEKEYQEKMNYLMEITGTEEEQFKEVYGIEYSEYCRKTRLKEEMIKSKVKDCIYNYYSEGNTGEGENHE